MNKRIVLGALAVIALGLLSVGCSTCPVRTGRYGPNYYDMDGIKSALVRINDTNYPALLRGNN